VSTAARIKSPLGALQPASGQPRTLTNTGGIEELKAVLRRSSWLILGVVVVGILAMNLVRQVRGPQYVAHARVVLNNTDLSSAALGINPAYQDPNRQDQAQQNLVTSPELYSYAAQRVGGSLGTGTDLMSKTSVTVTNNVVNFSAKTSDGKRSQLVVDAVATAYPLWRARVSGRVLDSAITQVRDQISRFGKTPDLASQLQQLQVLKVLNSGDTLFVEQATSATKTAPKPVTDSLLGGLIGLVVALLIVGARELFDTTVRTEADVENALEVPVIATIESLPRRLRTSVLGSHAGRFNDEYELLAAHISQIFDGHEGPVRLAVTSALPGEGKTTTASNLAVALSRRGTSVILADFDLRKPAVSEFFEIPRAAAGVTELLAGVADVQSVLWRVAPNGERSGIDRESRLATMPRTKKAGAATGELTQSADALLTVMPGGVARRGATPRFAKLPALLDSLPTAADFVVIDTPPALVVAGMAELAQSVDGVIVVVRHGFVHRRRLRALGRQALSWRTRILGAVMNDSPGEEGYLGYYYGQR